MAIRKLQITLQEFRKLCILKGIYPRKPSKAPKGNDKTYYLKKDIAFIAADPITKKLAERRAWKKKFVRARAKDMPDEVISLKKQKPMYTLSHVVKERYPTFDDALEDLDDCLSLIFFFATMPASIRISTSRINDCKNLSVEFLYYIMKTHSLRKVFVSIKGIYYQAEIRSHKVTWIVPFQFTMQEKKEVDYNVMLTFLEFYVALLGFVNFKMYQQIGLSYPPQFDLIKRRRGNFLEAITPVNPSDEKPKEREKPTKSKAKAQKKDSNTQTDPSKERISSLTDVLEQISTPDESSEEEEQPEEVEGKTEDVEEEKIFESDESNLMRKVQEVYEKLFASCHFWLSREVPKESLEFAIKSFGGRVSWDGNGLETDESITHYVVDRPKIDKKIVTRDYVQPQWVYDSINNCILLPPSDYTPGQPLPPHLSPFVDDYEFGYVPEYRKKLDDYYEEKTGLSRRGENPPVRVAESDSEEDEAKYAKELEDEQRGSSESLSDEEYHEDDEPQTPERKSRKMTKSMQQRQEEKQQQRTAEALLTAKRRRLARSFRRRQYAKQYYLYKLRDRRRKLQKGEATVQDSKLIMKHSHRKHLMHHQNKK
jgi:pescadillo protein